MTPAQIAALLGVPTQAELAAELGLPASALRPAELPRPCLVLDYRGTEGASRWARFAKPPIREIRKPLGLDSVTGLRLEKTT